MECKAWLFKAENGYCFVVIATTPLDFESIPITDSCFHRLRSLGWPVLEALANISTNKH